MRNAAAPLAAALAVLVAPASAQERGEPTAPHRNAPDRALELGASAAFSVQSALTDIVEYGDPAAGTTGATGGLAGAGLELGLGLGYRASPHFRIGITTDFGLFEPSNDLGSDVTVRGVAAAVEAAVHLAPHRTVDPVFSLATGYRLVWIDPRGTDDSFLSHGFRVARLEAGVDVRLADRVAAGPFVGVEIDYLPWVNPSGPGGNRAVPDPGASSGVQFGVAGTFDVGGRVSGPPEE